MLDVDEDYDQRKPEMTKVKTPGVRAVKTPLVRFSSPAPCSSPALGKKEELTGTNRRSSDTEVALVGMYTCGQVGQLSR